MWFSQVEYQFALAGITVDETKFNYVSGNLEAKYATEVRDIVTHPLSTGKYNLLKSELIKRLSESQEHKMRRLLEREEIGDRKPSQFLRHLRGLAGTVVPDDVLRPLWLGRLPVDTQRILGSQTRSTLDGIATLADSIADIAPSSGHIAETFQPRAADPLELILQRLNFMVKAQIAEATSAITTSLRQEIAAASGNRDQPRYNRPRSRSRGRSQSRDNNRSQPRDMGEGWYHRKFGADAKRCTTPCT
ncbi:uncharacterized protein LOC117182731 [Belonocnema kinseyi]|uniref:uncharacterized protein LOC117182731 n=1 Tax=Belonocnema kinseyi TaxID=2817044 RepID=UPI00143D92AA|nr:uncharacterized protein LOC117182731 [Belonocnema kinseyi]